jgi:hypothetical protein
MFITWDVESTNGDFEFRGTVGTYSMVGSAAGFFLGALTRDPKAIVGGTGAGAAVGLAAGLVHGGIGEAVDDQWEFRYKGKWRICCRCETDPTTGAKSWKPSITTLRSEVTKWKRNRRDLYYEIPD